MARKGAIFEAYPGVDGAINSLEMARPINEVELAMEHWGHEDGSAVYINGQETDLASCSVANFFINPEHVGFYRSIDVSSPKQERFAARADYYVAYGEPWRGSLLSANLIRGWRDCSASIIPAIALSLDPLEFHEKSDITPSIAFAFAIPGVGMVYDSKKESVVETLIKDYKHRQNSPHKELEDSIKVLKVLRHIDLVHHEEQEH